MRAEVSVHFPSRPRICETSRQSNPRLAPAICLLPASSQDFANKNSSSNHFLSPATAVNNMACTKARTAFAGRSRLFHTSTSTSNPSRNHHLPSPLRLSSSQNSLNATDHNPSILHTHTPPHPHNARPPIPRADRNLLLPPLHNPRPPPPTAKHHLLRCQRRRHLHRPATHHNRLPHHHTRHHLPRDRNNHYLHHPADDRDGHSSRGAEHSDG